MVEGEGKTKKGEKEEGGCSCDTAGAQLSTTEVQRDALAEMVLLKRLPV